AMVMPPKMDVLPSNVSEWPRKAPSRHSGPGRMLRLLVVVAALGGVLATIQIFVGFDQMTRWVVSISSDVRRPGSDLPESRNWAGYAASSGTFTAVSATW